MKNETDGQCQDRWHDILSSKFFNRNLTSQIDQSWETRWRQLPFSPKAAKNLHKSFFRIFLGICTCEYQLVMISLATYSCVRVINRRVSKNGLMLPIRADQSSRPPWEWSVIEASGISRSSFRNAGSEVELEDVLPNKYMCLLRQNQFDYNYMQIHSTIKNTWHWTDETPNFLPWKQFGVLQAWGLCAGFQFMHLIDGQWNFHVHLQCAFDPGLCLQCYNPIINSHKSCICLTSKFTCLRVSCMFNSNFGNACIFGGNPKLRDLISRTKN